MNRKEKAREFRAAAVLAAQGATDKQALTMPSMYPRWKPNVIYCGEGEPAIVRRTIDGQDQLFRCQQAHTSQVGWEPENAPALWVPINNTAAGTLEEPISAVRGMEYIYGKYYSDIEDGKTYLCTRTSEAEGGTVILQFMPHELVGQYFDEVAG